MHFRPTAAARRSIRTPLTFGRAKPNKSNLMAKNVRADRRANTNRRNERLHCPRSDRQRRERESRGEIDIIKLKFNRKECSVEEIYGA